MRGKPMDKATGTPVVIDYICRPCDRRFVAGEFGEGEAATCPRCGSHNTERYSEEARVGVAFSPTPSERLRALGTKRDQKQGEYGDNYKDGGAIIMALFPRGFVVQTEEEANRMTLIVHLATKLSRYCQNFKAGGHWDSLDDMAVYAMLLRDYDEEQRIVRDCKP